MFFTTYFMSELTEFHRIADFFDICIAGGGMGGNASCMKLKELKNSVSVVIFFSCFDLLCMFCTD